MRRDTSPLTRLHALAGALAGLALACSGGAAVAGGVIAFDEPGAQAPQTLTVSIPSVTAGGPLPTNYSADGRNLSPPLSWTAGPHGTRGFVVMMQDPDASTPEPALHWLLYGVPASVQSLPRGMRNVAEPTNPLGAAQGRNVHDTLGYTGPRPAQGDPPHHYVFQVFAVDRPIRTRPGAGLAAVMKAMSGHVIARGELATTYAAFTPKPPRTTAAPAPAPAPASGSPPAL